jgi:pyridoxine kinase
MPLALILSSYVAGSRVGGMVQALALAQFRIDPVLVPTVIYGRHPGWGPPGGAAVDPKTFKAVIDGVAAQGLLNLSDVILTGYFASAEQVWIAAETIDRAKAADREGANRPKLTVIVDPIMGDAETGLYVKEEVAEAIALDLVPRADVITPNLWELGRISGRKATTAREALQIARTLDRGVLVTSVPGGKDEIGLLYVDRQTSTLAVHKRLEGVPRGTGDLVTGLFAAALIEGQPPYQAVFRTAQGVAEAAEAAIDWYAPELPVVALRERLVRPTAGVRIETLS